MTHPTAPSPLILGFDTSGPHCAVALLSGDVVLATQVDAMQRGQAERLMPMLQEVLATTGHTWADLTGLGVGIGPGNFTGIRISVSAARGLALALDIPAVGVSTFAATSLDHAAPHVATVPAPRDQVYALMPDAAPHLVAGLETGLPVLTPPAPDILVANIARIARDTPAPAPRPAPLYVKAADAAPPRDPAPTILP